MKKPLLSPVSGDVEYLTGMKPGAYLDLVSGRGDSYRRAQQHTAVRMTGIRGLFELAGGVRELRRLPASWRVLDLWVTFRRSIRAPRRPRSWARRSSRARTPCCSSPRRRWSHATCPREHHRPAPNHPAQRPGGYRPALADRRYLLLLFAMLTSTLVYVQYLSAPVAGLVAGTIVWFFGEAVSAPTLFLACPAPAGPPELRSRYPGAADAMYGLRGPGPGPRGSRLGPLRRRAVVVVADS